jgi:hypothetical protein
MQLVQLGRRIAATPEGRGSYRFPDRADTLAGKKNAFWQSVTFHGADWRLVAIHQEQDASGKKVRICR